MECEALRHVRDDMGLTNVKIMIPFVRTLSEAAGVIALLEQNGLSRGSNGLQVIMMCELPSNAVLADQFLDYFDGFSIGSNDLTLLTLGLDRDSALVAGSFDERATRQSSTCCRWPSPPANDGVSTLESAARDRATSPTWLSGWSNSTSTRCCSTLTACWRPGPDWPPCRNSRRGRLRAQVLQPPLMLKN